MTATLDRWQRPSAPGPALHPQVAAEEFCAWVDDPGRWNHQAERDWKSLLDDVIAAWSQIGPRLAHTVDTNRLLDEVRCVRGQKRIVTDANRGAVERAAHELAVALANPDAIDAALDDLFEAAQQSNRPESLDDATRLRLALLEAACRLRGHDWAVVADRMRRTFEAYRNSATDEIIQRVRRSVATPPATGHSIVWLAIDNAYGWGPSPNPTVQLFEGDWLLGTLKNWSGPREGVPSELAQNPSLLPEVCDRVAADQHPNEQLPFAFVRVDLGAGLVAGTRERAADITDLLIAQAASAQGGTGWRAAGVCLHFVDGVVVFESGMTLGRASVECQPSRRDIVHDPTPESFRQETVRLRGHLPLVDPRIHEALRLSKWLSETRNASPPARLVLSGRVLEQTSSWSGIGVRELIDEYLSWAWAWACVAVRLAGIGTTAVRRLHLPNGSTGEDGHRKFLLASRIMLDQNLRREPPRADPWRTLTRIDWLVEQHPPDSEIGDALRELQDRLIDGAAARDWLDDERKQLRLQNARAVRTRNAAVHGGPIVSEVADTVVGVQDWLAARALKWTIDEIALGLEPRAGFERERTRFTDAFAQLTPGLNPTEVLIAGSGDSD